MSSSGSGSGGQQQIPKSLQGLAKANKATGLLMAYTAAFLTLGVIDYITERVSPSSRPVLAMHLNPANCQCPPCQSIREGKYHSHARNIYTVPVGNSQTDLSNAADSIQRLADDIGNWSQKGPPNTKPAVALEGSNEELAAVQGRISKLAVELRQKANAAGQQSSQQIGRGQ